MPRRGGQRNYNNGGNGGNNNRNNDGQRTHPPALKGYPNSHDDHKQRNRRVSFKPVPLGSSKGGVRLRISDSIRSRLAEDDDMMHEISERNDDLPLPRRKGSPIPRGKFGNTRKLVPSPYGWYQITIHNGQQYSMDELLRSLLAALSPCVFIPHHWRVEKTCATFFTDDFEAAERIQQLGRNAQLADGFRLNPRVRSGYPIITIDDEFKEKMKLVMAKRYTAATKALDMSRFHADPDLKSTFCPLFRTSVMAAALDIMESNIPNLEALNLNENNLTSMDAFRHIDKRLPNLKILYLADNKLTSSAHLLAFRNLPIVEAMLKNNPFQARCKERGQYISEVRRKFPKIVKLDGERLEPMVTMGDMNDTTLPTSRASFLCDSGAAEIIRQFLDQYFTIYDSDNRQPLLDAYHEQAMLSMSVPPASQAGRLVHYWKYNRNFRRVFNNDRESNKISLLKVGRLAVVSMLAELPKSNHDRQTFTVDLTLSTPQMMAFTVSGLFRDYDPESSQPTTSSSAAVDQKSSVVKNIYELRYFIRQYVIVPQGGGFCIRNETVLISSATYEQVRNYKRLHNNQDDADNPSGSTSKAATSTVVSGGAPVALGGLASSLQSRLQLGNNSTQQPLIAPAASVPMNEATKMQMVQAMSAQSNMNVDWSRKCLEETNWDFNHAAFVFEKLLKENKIPPEAFVK